jgi:osmoprotectant transport system permease protein
MGAFAEAFGWLTTASNYTGDDGIIARVIGHVLISSQSVLLAAAIAIPIGLYIGHKRRFEFLAVTVGNFGRALPSFGVLGLVFPFTFDIPGELGYWATFFALFLLSLPPLLTNTYVGIKGVDPDTVEAATGMGMKGREVLLSLEIPLAVPLIVAGMRTAAVQVVATATLGAYAGWDQGLGSFIRDGFSQGALGQDQLIGGAILVALLAIVTELFFGVLGRVFAPRSSSERDRRRFFGRLVPGTT